MSKKDEDIKKGVIDSLFWDGRVDASNVNVDVHDQEVTLRGTVPNYHASEAALFNAWRVPGVTKVDNQLLVKFPSNIVIPSDKNLQSHIGNMLQWTDSTRDADIKVKVNNGKVTLDGSVDAYWKKLRAEQIVKEAAGVVEITDRLAVVPSESVVDDIVGEDISKALDRSYAVDVDDVDVRVKDGIVTLSGKLPNRIAVDATIEAACNTLGVKQIINRLVVTK
jgi:osmotically-inducible protein OsmY